MRREFCVKSDRLMDCENGELLGNDLACASQVGCNESRSQCWTEGESHVIGHEEDAE